MTLSVLGELSLFAQTESSIKSVFWQPNQLQPGSVTFFTVELNREATKVSGHHLYASLENPGEGRYICKRPVRNYSGPRPASGLFVSRVKSNRCIR
jgi:hypothetical protein